MKRLCTLGVVVLWVLALSSIAESAPQTPLRDLENQIVDPFQVPSHAKAIVLLFTSTQCPISNRYAPEVRRLYEKFARRGVVFWLVYANPAESVDDIRAHVRAFSHPGRALRDPGHALVRLSGATVTPEAAVFDRGGRIVYRGRIDDRYASLGVDRQAPTTHDLENALGAVLAGRPVPNPVTRAVGCFLVDFHR
jgi:hypothetical protein